MVWHCFIYSRIIVQLKEETVELGIYESVMVTKATRNILYHKIFGRLSYKKLLRLPKITFRPYLVYTRSGAVNVHS